MTDAVQKTADYVREKFSGEGTGHDWWHLWRVWQLAKRISKKEGGSLEVIELAALLHDIADWKFQEGNDQAGPIAARDWLLSIQVAPETIEKIVHIVEHISYKGSHVENKIESLEGRVVQDADRLDALGAIGIARAFAYGGFRQRPLYDPDGSQKEHASFEEYQKGSDSTVHHFYEKLLLLKERMNTKTGKEMADERHRYMEAYLEHFMKEWKGEL